MTLFKKQWAGSKPQETKIALRAFSGSGSVGERETVTSPVPESHTTRVRHRMLRLIRSVDCDVVPHKACRRQHSVDLVQQKRMFEGDDIVVFSTCLPCILLAHLPVPNCSVVIRRRIYFCLQPEKNCS